MEVCKDNQVETELPCLSQNEEGLYPDHRVSCHGVSHRGRAKINGTNNYNTITTCKRMVRCGDGAGGEPRIVLLGDITVNKSNSTIQLVS